MLRYFSFSSIRTAGEKFSHTSGKLLHILAINFFPPDGLPFSPPGSDFTVSEALFFRFLQSLFFDQQPLPLIALPRTTPFQNDRS